VTGLLRKTMVYDGLVLSDDLEMKAVAGRYPAGDAARLAAVAGCDILLVCASTDRQVASVEALVRAAEQGEISFGEAQAASRRIRQWKERYLVPYRDPEPRAAREAAMNPAHRAIAEQIAS
jgi:beta-N-acetylhexosaminidase